MGISNELLCLPGMFPGNAGDFKKILKNIYTPDVRGMKLDIFAVSSFTILGN